MISAPITKSALQIAARASVPLPSPEPGGEVTADSTTVTADSTIITADNG